MNVLILGGTTEASALARALQDDPSVAAVLSLAGRTRAPVLPAGPSRRGGFGGVAGLVRHLREHRVEALVDATHPFAARISANAAAAAAETGIPRLLILRPEWRPQSGDRWTAAATMAQAAALIGAAPRRVFLTIGQQDLAPFAAAPHHDYLIRSVEPPDPAAMPPRARCIAARGPFTEAAEQALLAAERIEVLVTKNSGGDATAAKLAAARTLGLPVVMVERPPAVPGPTVPDAAAALRWLRHQAARRGV